MEKKGERSSDKMADSKRCSGRTQFRMDDYIAVSDGDEATVGVKELDVKGHLRGAGNGEVGTSGDGRNDVQVGVNEGRCGLLDQGREGYPCVYCGGGRDFDRCKAIRGMKK